MPKAKHAIVQIWEESERGWGTRPDGYSMHLSEEDLKAYVKEYWSTMPKTAPDEYSRPCGEPYLASVTAQQLKRIQKTKNGVRVFDRDYPPRLN